MARQLACEVCVVGAGPAGAIVARQLAQLHHDTVLVHRREPEVLRAESMTAATLSMLDSLCLRDRAERAVFSRDHGALVVWESETVRELPRSSVSSMLIDRSLFDAQMRAAARDAGARVLQASAVRSPTRGGQDKWSIRVDGVDGPTVITSAFFVDARGKRRRPSGSVVAARTVALSASWAPRGERVDATRLEALDDAWWWGMPTRDQRYSATVFVDEGRVAGSDAGTRLRLYRELLERTTLLRHLLDSTMTGDVNVCDATAGLSSDLMGQDFIRVGDAAWSIDPLSSQGLHRALVSAVQGAATIHTIRSDGDSAAASEFYVARHRQAALGAFENTARAYAQRRGQDRCAFWMRRSLSPSPDLSAPASLPTISRGALPSRLAVSSQLRIVDIPLLVGDGIVRGKAISHPALREPIAFLGGAPVLPLLAMVREETATATIVDRWAHCLSRDVARASVNWMYAAGLLVDSAAAFTPRRHPADIR